jgi:hypothetical protein
VIAAIGQARNVPAIPDCILAADFTTSSEYLGGGKYEEQSAGVGEAWSMFTLTTRGDAVVGLVGCTLADPAVKYTQNHAKLQCKIHDVH